MILVDMVYCSCQRKQPRSIGKGSFCLDSTMLRKISEKLCLLEAKRMVRWGTGKCIGWRLGKELFVSFDPLRIQTI